MVNVRLENPNDQQNLPVSSLLHRGAALPSAVHWYSSVMQLQHLAVDFHFSFSHIVAPLHLRLRLFSIVGWDFNTQTVLFDVIAQPV